MCFERVGNNFPAGWRKIVDTWGDLNNQYYSENEDLPAWYVENSNSALLSAAAWINGYPAICEMDIEKKYYTGERGRPRSYLGRMDMEISIDNTVYWIEAKRRAFSLSRSSNYSFRHSFIARSVGEARKNAAQYRTVAADSGAHMASVVFFSGHIEPDASERNGRGAPARRAELTNEEIIYLRDNIDNLSNSLKIKVYCAVFRRTDFEIPPGWKDYNWPAAFGMCAILNVSV